MSLNSDNDWDLTFMNQTEPVMGIQLGENLLQTHGRDKCAGRPIPCCIHNPSDHHMRTWTMNWRADTGVMERICPHDVGHPDPDHMAYVLSLTPEHECLPLYAGLDHNMECQYPHLEWQGIHSCDGCCKP